MQTRPTHVWEAKQGQRLKDRGKRVWLILGLEPDLSEPGKPCVQVFLESQDEIARGGIGLFVKKEATRLRVAIPWASKVDIVID